MPDLFTSKRLILLLLGLMLFSALIGLTSGGGKPMGWPVALVQDGVALFQSWFHKPARVVAGFFQDLREWKMLYDENQALKANLDQFARMSAELARLREENKRLRAMLDLRSSLDTYRLHAAEVIARSPDQWNQVLVINKGARDGVRPDMAVITTKGLIGRVTDVTPFTARVALLTDLSRSGHVSAVVQGEESRVFGVIDAYDFDTGYLLFQKIPAEAPIREGQVVVTSGLGGVFPRGLVIGTVVAVEPGDNGLTQRAYVKPAADFAYLDEVFVVERKDAVSPEANAATGHKEVRREGGRAL